MTEPLVEIEDLERYFYENDSLLDRILQRDSVAVRAVDGVTLDIRQGETVGLVGESGCGKSTTGETLLRLQEPTGGTVRFDGQDVYDLSDTALAEFRRRAQILFQDPFSSLDPRMTVASIVRQPLDIHNWPRTDSAVATTAELTVDGIGRDRVTVTAARDIDRVVTPTDGIARASVAVERTGAGADSERENNGRGVSTVTVDGQTYRVTVTEDLTVEASVANTTDDAEIDVQVSVGRSGEQLRRTRVRDLLERVGLSTDQLERYPGEFSGGQRQRIGIARALALDPEFLVLDEPTSALDVSVQAQILNLLEELQDELGLTYLLISHDLSVIRHICDRVAVMYLGEIAEVGPAEAVFATAKHPYTKSLLESVPRARSDEQDRSVTPLSGDVPSPRDPPTGCRFRTRCPEVIPPPGLDLDQHQYRAIMDLRQRVEQRAISDETISAVTDIELTDTGAELRTDDGTAGQQAPVDLLADRLLSVDLPSEHETYVREALTAVIENEYETAATRLSERYESVCERANPQLVGQSHPVACHLYDD